MSKQVYTKMETNNIIKIAQEGDSKALEELIRRIQKSIYTIFFHLMDKKDDIADLTQEVLIKMAKMLPELKNIKKFKSWINRIAINVFYDYVKANPNKNLEYDLNKLNEIKDKIGCEPGEKCLFSELEKLIRATLMTLPQSLRISLILREYEGLSYDEISKITNTTQGTVKSRISRARLKMREKLQEFI